MVPEEVSLVLGPNGLFAVISICEGSHPELTLHFPGEPLAQAKVMLDKVQIVDDKRSSSLVLVTSAGKISLFLKEQEREKFIRFLETEMSIAANPGTSEGGLNA